MKHLFLNCAAGVFCLSLAGTFVLAADPAPAKPAEGKEVKAEVKEIKEVKRKKAFDINIALDQTFSVNGGKGRANMILFHGDMKSAFFNGKIVQGGVDTQKMLNGQDFQLSARYILEGTDANGKPAKIFIENNGTMKNGGMVTKPIILTDNQGLRWLETTDFEGKIAPGPQGVTIEFYAPEDVKIPGK